MDRDELKKLLAGLSIASLIVGAGLSVTGCATARGGEKTDAGGIGMEKGTTTDETPSAKPAAGSG
jgi:radical SAM modification target selenobiotic family peptide